MPRPWAARTGMALILTLAAIVLAGGLALYLQAQALALARVEQAELLQERLRLAAAEAARDALWTLASDEDLAVDHLGEDWALPHETVQEDGLSTRAVVEVLPSFSETTFWVRLSNPALRHRRAPFLSRLSLSVAGRKRLNVSGAANNSLPFRFNEVSAPVCLSTVKVVSPAFCGR